MKKLLIATLLLMGQTLISQTVKYVVFTSNLSTPVQVHVFPPEDEDDFRSYFIERKESDGKECSKMFLHFIDSDDDPNPLQVLTKPISFLNTIQYDDWDLMQELSCEQINQKYHDYAKYDHLYFIDRRDFTGTTMILYEVIPLCKGKQLY